MEVWEFVHVLEEVRRVARLLEADREVTMSRAPRLLLELHETLLVMAGKMRVNDEEKDGNANSLVDLDSSDDNPPTSFTKFNRTSSSQDDASRDRARMCILKRRIAKEFASEIAYALDDRFAVLWLPVSDYAARWRPSETVSDDEACESDEMEDRNEFDEPDRAVREPRRALLFHIAAMLDVNECGLDFLRCTDDEKVEYVNILERAVVREAIELDGDLARDEEMLVTIFKGFHKNMRSWLEKHGRCAANAALEYWKRVNTTTQMISPVPFNLVAQAALSSQASSAAAERVFSDLGRIEGSQRQSLLSGTLEMTEVIRGFVTNELSKQTDRQTSLLHSQATQFREIVDRVSVEIIDHETGTSPPAVTK